MAALVFSSRPAGGSFRDEAARNPESGPERNPERNPEATLEAILEATLKATRKAGVWVL